MKHIRDPVTGRCAVCESNGLDPSVLHNGIFYPESSPRPAKPPKPQLIAVREDAGNPSPRPPPASFVRYPDKPASETAQSVASTASASQVTFATQTSFHVAPSPPASPPPVRRERRNWDDEPPRYSPEGSPSRTRNSDPKPRDPQVWFIGDSPRRSRTERSVSPDRTVKQRQRSLSPDYRRRDDRGTGKTYDSYGGYSDKSGYRAGRGRCSRCCRCRGWCTCRRCCMIFWTILLILLALGALAAAIYFAVAGAENEQTVRDVTLLKDPRYLILGYDQPCRTTTLSDPTAATETTVDATTADSTATTVSTTPTTTLILCDDKTTTVIQSGYRYRNGASQSGVSVIIAIGTLLVTLTHL